MVMRSPYLRWFAAEGREQVFVLSMDETLLGRKSDADVILTDPYVSRHHAKIVKGQDGYDLVDLQSTHGSFVNGHRVTEQVLRSGDRISLGQGRSQVEITYFVGNPQEGHDRTTIDEGASILELTQHLPSADMGQSDLEKMSMLLDFQYNFGRNFSANGTFEQILLSALKISGAERGFILMGTDAGFEYVVGMDGDGRILEESEFMQASQTVVRQVAATGEEVFMTRGIAGDLAQQDSIVSMHLRALACLPLKWISPDSEEMEVRGILYLDSTKTMHALSGLDEKILSQLALEAGNVFEKLNMLEALEERKVFEKEMALAKETQRTLLPSTLPKIESYELRAFSEPTHHVGGDFYDFYDVGTNVLIGVLADVSGKGVSAALLGSLLQGALDLQLRSGIDSTEALARANRFICERSQSNRFVTLFLFSLDESGKGHYVGAGHNPAYLYRKEDGTIEELRSANLVLGAFDFADYSATPIQLNQGDLLVVYSDGLTEAENMKGDMFEEERLIKLIQENGSKGAGTLQKSILDAIENFTQNRAQTDDITFLLTERINALGL